MVYRLDGKRQVRTVRLNRGGDGRKKVPFDGRKVAAVSVSLINASTRYACNKRTYLACAGKPVDATIQLKPGANTIELEAVNEGAQAGLEREVPLAHREPGDQRKI